MGNSKLAQQVETAKAKLEQALEAGSDTTQARADLDAALAKLAAADAPQGQPDTAAPDTDLDAEADALAMEATKEISARIEALCQIDSPKVEISVAAARDLVRAKQDSERAQEQLQAWQQRVENLEARIAEHEGRRQSILARRLTGDAKANDAAEVQVIELDLGGLRNMLERVKATRPEQVGASAPEVEWHRAQDAAEMRARHQLIGELQERICALAMTEPKPAFADRCRVHPKLAELIRHGVWG